MDISSKIDLYRRGRGKNFRKEDISDLLGYGLLNVLSLDIGISNWDSEGYYDYELDVKEEIFLGLMFLGGSLDEDRRSIRYGVRLDGIVDGHKFRIRSVNGIPDGIVKLLILWR